MITNLQYLGIYEDSIDSAINSCEEALKQLEFDVSDIDRMNDYALEDLKACGDWNDITNSIINAYFSTTQWFIAQRYPEIDTDYYVNGYDSHFYIGGDEV